MYKIFINLIFLNYRSKVKNCLTKVKFKTLLMIYKMNYLMKNKYMMKIFMKIYKKITLNFLNIMIQNRIMELKVQQ
jgi:hypothetical protein